MKRRNERIGKSEEDRNLVSRAWGNAKWRSRCHGEGFSSDETGGVREWETGCKIGMYDAKEMLDLVKIWGFETRFSRWVGPSPYFVCGHIHHIRRDR